VYQLSKSKGLRIRRFENELTNFGAKWSTWQGHEMVNFGGQRVKGQGHTRWKTDWGPGRGVILNPRWVEYRSVLNEMRRRETVFKTSDFNRLMKTLFASKRRKVDLIQQTVKNNRLYFHYFCIFIIYH